MYRKYVKRLLDIILSFMAIIILSPVYIIISILVLGLIILIHEFGHFVMAKLFKVPVREFSLGMSIGLGFIFGPAIGGVLGHFSLQLPFIVSASLIALLFVYALAVLQEPERTGEANKRALMPVGATQFFKYRIRYLFLFSFFVTFTLAGVEATFQLFQIDNIQITPLQLGYLFMVSGFADAAIQGGVVRRIKDGAETKWLIGAQIVTAVGLFLIVVSSNLVVG